MENNNHQSHQLLHSYCLNPDIKVETQGVNERVLLVIRAHPISQIGWIFNIVILLTLLVTLNILLFGNFSAEQVFFVNFFSIVMILSYGWYSFLTWFFNVGVVTNQRVIDIDFMSVIYKEMTIAQLNKIEDVTSKTGGYFASFFDLGNVFVQTAGTEANIEFENVPKPSEIVRIIDELVGR